MSITSSDNLHLVEDGSTGREKTLAASYYIEEAVTQKEKTDLLLNSWQFVCHETQLANPGDFYAFTLHDQDMFLVRQQDGTLSGYFNVCPHRGHRLVEGEGNKSRITCPYHAWTFNLDGRLRGARGVQGVKDNAERYQLLKVNVDQLVGFVFVNADLEAASLAEFAPGLEEQMLAVCEDLPEFVVDVASDEFGHSYICNSNWKVMLDNYLECYHCQMAHPEFNEMMAIADSKFTLYQNFTHQYTPTAHKAENKAFPLDLEHDVLIGNFWFLYPNTAIGQFPGAKAFYISRFDPMSAGVTDRRTLNMKPAVDTDPGAAERDQLRAKWTREVVSQEDKELCENVQRGMQQKAFKNGWYVTNPDEHGISEHAMRYFHSLYLDWAKAAGLENKT